MDPEDSTHSERWPFLGNRLPTSEIVYFCQMTVVFVIILTARVNCG